MKLRNMFGMAVLGLMAAACSNDVSEVLAPEAPALQGIPFTATIAPKTMDATTRALALSDDEKSLNAAWVVGEKIALIYKVGDSLVRTEAEVSDVTDGTATITAELAAGVTDGTEVKLIYPFDASIEDSENHLEPSGLTGDISDPRLDTRFGFSTIKVTGEVSTLKGGATLAAPYGIVEFKFESLAGKELEMKSLNIELGDGLVFNIATGGAANSILYAALPYLTDAELWFTAIDSDDKPYVAKATANISSGYFYQTTLKMATVGDVILADGKFAAPKTEGAEAMIAYLGTEATDAPHGLAIALEDLGVALNWENAKSSANNWNSTHTINYGIWRLPSAYDWQRMFIACGSTNSYLEPLTDDNHSDEFISDDFRDKLMYAGNIDDSIDVDVKSQMYWTATEYGSYAWYYHFYTEKFGWNDTATGVYARAALAF